MLGWWGVVHSHFRVQPNYSVEVVLCCVVVGVVTKWINLEIGVMIASISKVILGPLICQVDYRLIHLRHAGQGN